MKGTMMDILAYSAWCRAGGVHNALDRRDLVGCGRVGGRDVLLVKRQPLILCGVDQLVPGGRFFIAKALHFLMEEGGNGLDGGPE